MPKSHKHKPTWRSAQARRAYRHAVAIAKKKGLVSKSIDARKVTPSSNLTRTLNRFADAIEGRAKVFKLGKDEARRYRAAGYNVQGDRIAFPVRDDVDVRLRKGRLNVFEKISSNSYIETIVLPIPFEDLEQWLSDAKNYTKYFKAKKGFRFAFRYDGNNSLEMFSDMDELFKYLEVYKVIQWAEDRGDEASQLDVYRNIELVEVKTGHWSTDRAARNAVKIAARRRRKGFKSRERATMDKTSLKRVREREAEAKRHLRQAIRDAGGYELDRLREYNREYMRAYRGKKK